jgi:hypothetical protein
VPVTSRSGWLGYDPAPGEPAALRELGRAGGRTAGALAVAAAELRALAGDGSGWRGEAAEACRERLGRLPAQLEEAAGGLRAAHTALELFADRLDDAQRHAWRIAREAEAVRARADDPWAEELLERLRWRARALHDEVLGESIAAERALRAAADLAPAEPGWFERFVRSNTTLLEGASVVLGVAAGIAAATGVGMAVAPALAGLSLAASLALHHYGEADEAALVLAVVGAMTAGVGTAAAVAGRSAWAAAGAATAAGRLPTRAAAVSAAGRVADDVGWAVTAHGVGSFAGTVTADARNRQPRAVCRTTSTPARSGPAIGPRSTASLLDGPPSWSFQGSGPLVVEGFRPVELEQPTVPSPDRLAGPVVPPAP